MPLSSWSCPRDGQTDVFTYFNPTLDVAVQVPGEVGDWPWYSNGKVKFIEKLCIEFVEKLILIRVYLNQFFFVEYGSFMV